LRAFNAKESIHWPGGITAGAPCYGTHGAMFNPALPIAAIIS